MIESIDAATYLQMLNEIRINNGQAPRYTYEDINYRKLRIHGYPNTDWFAVIKACTAGNAIFYLSGRKDFRISFLRTTFQDAIYKNSATNYKQSNFRINLDGSLNDYISYGLIFPHCFRTEPYY